MLPNFVIQSSALLATEPERLRVRLTCILAVEPDDFDVDAIDDRNFTALRLTFASDETVAAFITEDDLEADDLRNFSSSFSNRLDFCRQIRPPVLL